MGQSPERYANELLADVDAAIDQLSKAQLMTAAAAAREVASRLRSVVGVLAMRVAEIEARLG